LYDHFNTLEDEEIFNELGIWGTPYWNKELAYGYAGNEVYLIPLADENTNGVDAIIFLYVDTDHLRYQMCINDQDQYLDKELGLIFNFFENELFGVKEDYLYPSPLEETYLGETKATMIEYCNEVWAGSPSTGWSYRGRHCWTKVIHESFDRENDETGGWGGSIHGDISNPIGGGSGLLSPLPEVLPTEKLLADEKLNCVWGNLQTMLVNGNSLLTSIFLQFSDLNYDPQDIIIDIVPKIIQDGATGAGSCEPWGNGYLINISKQFVDNRAAIENANTFIHELLHAHLLRQEEITNGTFVEMYGKLVRIRNGVKDLSGHEIMRKFYIPAMVNALKQYDGLSGISRTDDTYINLAWSGLYNELGQTDRERIKKQVDDTKIQVRSKGLECN